MSSKHEKKSINLSSTGTCRIAVLSDTHSRPHPALLPLLIDHQPSLILHAGDVGDAALLAALDNIARTVFVRGNIDPKGPSWPESVCLQLKLPSGTALDLLLLHMAIVHLRLNRRSLDLLRLFPSQLIVFGHSHVPYIGQEGKVWLFNPGAAGPSRFRLPTTLGMMELSSEGLRMKHLDLTTGRPWTPE